MSDLDTRPPASFADRQYHWLRSDLATGLRMSEWMHGRWHSAGEADPITPSEMRRRGWEWYSACFVPSGEDCSPTVEEVASELLRRRVEAACRRMAVEAGIDPDALAISPIGSEPVRGPMKIILVHKTEPAWHAFSRLAQVALQEDDDGR